MKDYKIDFNKITEKYYSKWIGCNDILFAESRQITFFQTEERNKKQPGYNKKFDLYVFIQEYRIFVSFGKNFANQAEALKESITDKMSIAEIEYFIKNITGIAPSHNIKYAFKEMPCIKTEARPLSLQDFGEYLNFFKKVNTGCRDTSWLSEYFTEMVENNLCFGIFRNSALVSCTDAPEMPYMQNEVQEIGINTVEEFRGNGYAADACISCLKEIIKGGKCPIWSAEIKNIASQKLAEKIGFVKFAETITVSL